MCFAKVSPKELWRDQVALHPPLLVTKGLKFCCRVDNYAELYRILVPGGDSKWPMVKVLLQLWAYYSGCMYAGCTMLHLH